MRARLGAVAGIAGAAALAACVAAVPPELIDARLMYDRASEGPASELAADELVLAAQSLQRAEREYQRFPRSQEARDLAYVAQRRVLIAESRARAEQAKKARDAGLGRLSEQNLRTASELAEARARLEEERRQGAAEKQELAREQAERSAREEELARTQGELERRQEQLESERQAREQAEQQAREALSELDRFAQLREEARGTVISLPGSLLFSSGQTELASRARSRLEEVARVLKQHPRQKLVIEGHSDSKGPDDYNYELSYLRALAVRDELVSRGIPASQVEVIGFGETKPIAPNATAEGRATNRRVEIVLQRVGEEAPGLGGAGQEPEGEQR